MAKFQVGQRVVLTSRVFPQWNGEYIIEGVHAPVEDQRLLRTDEPCNQTAYTLSTLDGYWAESALREAD